MQSLKYITIANLFSWSWIFASVRSVVVCCAAHSHLHHISAPQSRNPHQNFIYYYMKNSSHQCIASLCVLSADIFGWTHSLSTKLKPLPLWLCAMRAIQFVLGSSTLKRYACVYFHIYLLQSIISVRAIYFSFNSHTTYMMKQMFHDIVLNIVLCVCSRMQCLARDFNRRRRVNELWTKCCAHCVCLVNNNKKKKKKTLYNKKLLYGSEPELFLHIFICKRN